MGSVELILGAERIDRSIKDADDLLRQYRADTGCDYLDYETTIPHDLIVPEDLAVTLLVNSQASWRACKSLMQYGQTLNIKSLTQGPLEETSQSDRLSVAKFIATMAQWPGFAASLATKVLHKKRPDLIPILDNQAIFGAYMSKTWPGVRASGDSVKDERQILEALDWIAFDITRPENASAWDSLRRVEPSRTRIQLFDSVWWMHFRTVQPVRPVPEVPA